MKMLPLFFCSLLLLCSAEGWARRRRLTVVVERSSNADEKRFSQVIEDPQEGSRTELIVERSSNADEKRFSQVIEDPQELIVEELEKCVENVLACGFLLKCQCCNEPNFYSCAAPSLIGFQDVVVSGFANLLLRETKEERKQGKLERKEARKARKEARKARKEARQEKKNLKINPDEGGCHLRIIEFEGHSLCLPGNVAALLAIVDASTKGKCKPSFPMSCNGALDDEVDYVQLFQLPDGRVEITVAQLNIAGYPCEATEEPGEIKCWI